MDKINKFKDISNNLFGKESPIDQGCFPSLNSQARITAFIIFAQKPNISYDINNSGFGRSQKTIKNLSPLY